MLTQQQHHHQEKKDVDELNYYFSRCLSIDLTAKQKLGEGSFGIVYKGMYCGNEVAIKVEIAKESDALPIEAQVYHILTGTPGNNSPAEQFFCSVPRCLYYDDNPKAYRVMVLPLLGNNLENYKEQLKKKACENFDKVLREAERKIKDLKDLKEKHDAHRRDGHHRRDGEQKSRNRDNIQIGRDDDHRPLTAKTVAPQRYERRVINYRPDATPPPSQLSAGFVQYYPTGIMGPQMAGVGYEVPMHSAAPLAPTTVLPQPDAAVKYGVMSHRTVMIIAAQMLDRLRFIHGRGVVHKDIKPENIVVMGSKGSKRYDITLLDFGMGRFYTKDDGSHIAPNHQEIIEGTFRFMGIHTHQAREASRRDDFQSLAYTLIYLLLGKLPWQGVTGDEGREIKCRDSKTPEHPARNQDHHQHKGCDGCCRRTKRKGDGRHGRHGADTDVETTRSLKTIRKREAIFAMKCSTDPKKLCTGLPEIFADFLSYSNSLEFTQKPDYDYWRCRFYNTIAEISPGGSMDCILDW